MDNYLVSHIGNVCEKLASLLYSETLSDIKFNFPQEKRMVHAHKLILSVQSDVFNSQFNGPLATKDDTIEMNYCTANEFMEILRYCYSDKVILNQSNVNGILFAANYYNISGLEKRCCEFELKHLNVENVCDVYDKYYTNILNTTEQITERCLRIFDEKMSDIIRQDVFRNLSKPALKNLLQRDSLDVNEFELFKAIRYWAEDWSENQYDKQSKIFEVHEDLFKLIRFPIMSLGNFLWCCDASGTLFSEEDVKDIKHYIKKGEINETLAYSTTKREYYMKGIVQFRESYYVGLNAYKRPAQVPGESLLMEFTVKTKVKITYFELIPHENCKHGSVVYGVELSTRDGTILFKNESPSPDIYCSGKVLLKPNVNYKLTSWENNHFENVFNEDNMRNNRCSLKYHQFDRQIHSDCSSSDSDCEYGGPIGPFAIKFNSINKTYISQLSFEMLKCVI